MLINIFKKPEIINKQDHKNIKILRYDNYNFSKDSYIVPIGLEEIEVAMKSLLLVFVKEESGEIFPATILGTQESSNLLINKDGKWKKNTYIPASIRAYPFGISSNDKEKYIVIDTKAECIQNNKGESLFNDDLSNSKQGDFSFKFVNDVYTQIEVAKYLGKELDSYGLLKQANIEITKDNKKYTLSNGIYVVDEVTLNKLESRKLKKLATKGALKLIYAHLFSLSNKY